MMESSMVCFHRTSKIRPDLNEHTLGLSCFTLYFSSSDGLYFRKKTQLRPPLCILYLICLCNFNLGPLNSLQPH